MKRTLFQIATAAILAASSILAGGQVAFGATQNWTETTLSDFAGGSFDQTQASIWNPGDPADDGNIVLQSRTLDQSNWGPAYPPSTPAVYGTQYEGQTFRAGKSGRSLIFTLFLIKVGNPADLVVELRDCTTNNPGTAKPGVVLGSGIITGSQVTESGNANDAAIELPVPIAAGSMYSIVVRQSGDGGTGKDYYKWWYGDDYSTGQAWKQSSSSSGWEGSGFGSHDCTFRTYVGDSETKSYYPAGSFVSPVFDAGANTTFGVISWSGITPAGTAVKFQVATSNDTGLPWNFLGPDGSSGAYYQTSGTPVFGAANTRYIRYKAFLSTGSSEQTPVLAGVSITYNVSSSPPALDHIVISPKTAEVAAGDTVNYSAEAFDRSDISMGDVTAGSAFAIQSGAGGAWSNSSYTSQNAGTWTVTGSYNGKTDSASLTVTGSGTVTEAPVTAFVFAPVSSPQLAGTPFAVAIRAVDQYGNTVTSFTNTANLSDNSSSISPVVTGSFSAGVWSGNVTVAGIWNNDFITASSGAVIGNSNTFSVVSPAPALDHIVISPKTASVIAGTAVTYAAVAFDRFNNSMGDVTSGTVFTIQAGAAGTWAANRYTSQNAGTWTVIGARNGKTDSASLTVSPASSGGSGGGGGGAGGGGGGGTVGAGDSGAPPPATATEPTANFTVDFLGRLTSVPMSVDSRLQETIVAGDPGDIHAVELAAGTRVTNEQGNAIDLITIRETANVSIPKNSFIVGQAYDFSPSNATFDQPMKITLSYPASILPANVSSVGLAYYAQSGWQDLPIVDSEVAELCKLTAPTTHLSVYAILATVRPAIVPVPGVAPVASVIQPAPVIRALTPAQFMFSDLRIETSNLQRWDWFPVFVRVGADASVSVSIANAGQESGSDQVTLKVNGQSISTQTLDLPAGQSGRLLFTLPDNAPGLYTIEVGGLNATFESYARINWLLIGFVIPGAAVLAWLIWRAERRRRMNRAGQQG